MDEYDGRQFVGIDLHRQRSVIVRQTESGDQLSAVRIVNGPVALQLQLKQAGAIVEMAGRGTLRDCTPRRQRRGFCQQALSRPPAFGQQVLDPPNGYADLAWGTRQQWASLHPLCYPVGCSSLYLSPRHRFTFDEHVRR